MKFTTNPNQKEELDILWVTWERQIRNRSMAGMVGAEYHEIISHSGRLARYLSSMFETVKLILRIRPGLVFAPNPSVVLAVMTLMLRPFFGYRFAIDAHYGGIVAYNGNRIFQSVLDYCNRKADLVVVTTEAHFNKVQEVGGLPFVCQDPLPEILANGEGIAAEEKKVFFICSFDQDEPYKSVFEGARLLLDQGFKLHVSGNYRKVAIDPQEFDWISFLGFVDEESFYRHLFSSEIVVDLTENEDCLVCGAYESVAAGKPMVLSDKAALVEFFSAGAIFTDHRPESIADAVRRAHAKREELMMDLEAWARDYRARMAKTRSALLKAALGVGDG